MKGGNKVARIDANGEREIIVKDTEGTRLERFNLDLNGIRSIKGMLQGLWTLNPFSHGLSGRNGFSDVDAHTEIDGRGLVLEFKRSFRSLNKGQVLKAIRQAKFQKTCTWFIEGETDTPKRIFCVNETGVDGEFKVSEVEVTDLEKIQVRISKWEKWARQNSLVKGNKTGEWNATVNIINNARTSA